MVSCLRLRLAPEGRAASSFASCPLAQIGIGIFRGSKKSERGRKR